MTGLRCSGGTVYDNDGGATTPREFAAWLETQPYARATKRLYGGFVVRAHARGETTPQTAAGALAARSEGIPPGTVAAEWSAVRAWAKAAGVDPAELQKPRIRKAQARARDSLTPNALVRYTRDVDVAVRAKLKAHNPIGAIPYFVLLLLPLTGLRIEEACTLRRDGIQKKGKRWGLLFVGKGNKERWVPLMDPARKVLLRALHIAKHHGSTEWVFPAPSNPKLPIPQDTVRKALHDLRRNWPEDMQTVSPHVMRHTFFTTLARRGVNLRFIQDIAGHSSITTTQAYLHPSTDDLADALTAAFAEKKT